MDKITAKVDGLQDERVCVNVIRSVHDGAWLQLAQTVPVDDPDAPLDCYRADKWEWIPPDGPEQDVEVVSGLTVKARQSFVKRGGRWFILDVPVDVALAIRDALNEHFDPASVEAAVNRPGPGRSGQAD